VHLQEVGHADGLGPSRLLDLLQFSPSLLKVLVGLCEPGSVDQVEVHVLEAKLLEGNFKGFDGGTLLLGRDLCGDIKLFAGNTACLDGMPKLFLVSVDFLFISNNVDFILGDTRKLTLGAIKMTISGLDSLGCDVNYMLVKPSFRVFLEQSRPQSKCKLVDVSFL
jgi:hypothetical protein